MESINSTESVFLTGDDLSSLDGFSQENGSAEAVTLVEVKEAIEVTNGLLGYIFAEILFLMILCIASMLYRLLHHNVTKFIH